MPLYFGLLKNDEPLKTTEEIAIINSKKCKEKLRNSSKTRYLKAKMVDNSAEQQLTRTSSTLSTLKLIQRLIQQRGLKKQ
jgi:hypothetical protein